MCLCLSVMRGFKVYTLLVGDIMCCFVPCWIKYRVAVYKIQFSFTFFIKHDLFSLTAVYHARHGWQCISPVTCSYTPTTGNFQNIKCLGIKLRFHPSVHVLNLLYTTGTGSLAQLSVSKRWGTHLTGHQYVAALTHRTDNQSCSHQWTTCKVHTERPQIRTSNLLVRQQCTSRALKALIKIVRCLISAMKILGVCNRLVNPSIPITQEYFEVLTD